MTAQRMLIVERSTEAHARLRQSLETHGWSVLESSSITEVSEIAKSKEPQLMIFNVELAGDQERGKAMGASAYLIEPCDLNDTLQAIHTSMKNPSR